jgi:N-carbamoyl-L-amino-acid hydrolase
MQVSLPLSWWKSQEIAITVGGASVQCGMIKYFPNAINVIPGKVVLTVDLRNSDEASLADAERLLLKNARIIEKSDDVKIELKLLEKVPAVKFDDRIVSTLEKVSNALGRRFRRMISSWTRRSSSCPACVLQR